MPQPKRVRFYLDPDTKRRAEAGEHNFIRKIENVLRPRGFEVSYHRNVLSERLKAVSRRGYSLSEMTPPPNLHGLTFRRVYHYPFWQIQPTEKRWHWDVARADFPAADIPMAEAKRFYSFWQKRVAGSLLGDISDDGFVYIPLQGRLLDQRSFQICTPLDMIARTRAACPDRDIVATLHPKETYTQAERAALERLAQTDTRLTIQTGGREVLLPRCSFVVTMNSGLAFDAMFFGKPAVTFARTDFHHATVDGQDADAFQDVETHCPNYAAYVWWVWQHMAINAGHGSAEAKIAAKLKAAGWPMA
ncbi:capsular polysaccharide export protein, LipB/KpsS family [Tateyamaria omphalii]|uniref:Capsular biosynthesis protein n=1 Tax=Tateyamaria omphalii TaxID=299262 RepID=A0A1P8MYR1_9RHOB|nr:hypothetical protein [Tateyamaria omphalii]APX13102.1 hypothetical protein BWR18_16475 [Tateyamaria omphalii]